MYDSTLKSVPTKKSALKTFLSFLNETKGAKLPLK
jgi:hypothetical protein